MSPCHLMAITKQFRCDASVCWCVCVWMCASDQLYMEHFKINHRSGELLEGQPIIKEAVGIFMKQKKDLKGIWGKNCQC